MRIRKTVFGRQKAKANTFIGGVSSTLNTAALVATKLGIAVSRVKSFKIKGSDIEFSVTGGSYNIPGSAFLSNLNIKYYDDVDGLVSGILAVAFANTTNLEYVRCKNATVIQTLAFSFSGLRGNNCNFDSVTTFTTGGIFSNIQTPTSVILNFPSLTTMPAYTAAATASFNSSTLAAANKITINVPVGLKTSNAGIPHTQLTTPTISATIVNYIGWTDTTDYNTELGSLGSYYANKGLLAAKLGIGSGGLVNIQNIGGHLRFNALAKYVTSINAFNFNTVITYFDDSIAGMVTNMNIGTFSECTILWAKMYGIINLSAQQSVYGCTQLYSVEMPNMVNFSAVRFGSNCPLLLVGNYDEVTTVGSNNCLENTRFTSLSMKKCTSLGTTTGENGVFLNIPIGATIKVANSLKTVNSGSPDGDLEYARISRGATIVYE